jgi:hypothetical protein
MSEGAAFRALIAANAPVVALVGTRIAQDRIDQGKVRPFIVYGISSIEPQRMLDGTVIKTRVTIDVQCWGDTRLSADAVADAVTTAVRAVVPQSVSGRSTVYDGELDLEATVLVVEWWE